MRSLLALFLFVLSVSGAELEVSNWVVPPESDPYYPSKDAYAGDTIVFTWPEGNIIDVHIHPTGNCEEDGAILVGYQSGASYAITEKDVGKDLFFACDVGRRCEAGQNIKVRVLDLPSGGAEVNAVESGIDSSASTNGLLLTIALATGSTAVMIY